MFKIIQCDRPFAHSIISELQPGEEALLVFGSVPGFVQKLRNSQAILADFDNTCTMNDPLGFGGNSHELIREILLTPELQAAESAMADRYFSNHVPSAEEIMHMLTSGADRLRRSGVTRRQLEALASVMPMRPGLPELFESVGHAEIASYGYATYIDPWVDLNVLRPWVKVIHAMRFTWDESGVVSGYDPRTPVTPEGKGRVAERMLERLSLRPEELLVLGDSQRTDQFMMDRGLSVLIVPPSEMDSQVGASTMRDLEKVASGKKSLDFADSILVDEGFDRLVELYLS